MHPDELIESYVAEVALKLPRAQRNDVAFELRELLQEELQARAEGAGREADAALAGEMLRAFGRPADVAARYRPAVAVVDPEDGRSFLWASAIGLAIIWANGLVVAFQRPIASGWDLLQAIAVWWGTAFVPSFWWPGVLVAVYAAAAWSRRRRPRAPEWTPRDPALPRGGRAAKGVALAAVLGGIFLLADPTWLLDFFWRGRAAPAAYEALTYTETFRRRQGPVLLALLLANLPIFAAVLAKGRWSPLLRRIETGHTLVLCAAMVWTVAGGPVLPTEAGDRTVKAFLVAITALTLLWLGVRAYRRVRPAPNRRVAA